MADGQPHDCVTVARPRHSGTAHVWQSSRVAVTVGHPVWEVGGGGGPVGTVMVVTPWSLVWVLPGRGRGRMDGGSSAARAGALGFKVSSQCRITAEREGMGGQELTQPGPRD
jgi:hypothetical protein